MAQSRVDVRRRIAVAFLLGALALALSGVGQRQANADISAVTGSAYGFSGSISLFGGPPMLAGPAPTVTLPPGGSAIPVTATAATGSAQFGPATLFTSGQLDVSTQGTTGPTGSVTSSATIQNVNTSGQEAFTAAGLASTCTASEAGVSGSTTITNGTLVTDSGDDDPNNPIPDHGPVTVNLPVNPVPNSVIDGHIHVNGATDSFQYTFNEQVMNPGSITVYAAHQRLLGPTAVGDLFVGKSECGVTVVPSTTSTSTTSTISTSTTSTTLSTTTTTSTSTTSSTTSVPTTTSTTLSTTTTTSTSTTVPSTTSTTAPSSTTTLPPSACGGLTPTISGTSGSDLIFGTSGPDVISGGGGGDLIRGLGGNDVICGGDGSDQIYGGEGADRILGDAGSDQLLGENGNDTLSGGAASDQLRGGDGNDSLSGGSEPDTCSGEAGTDTATTCEVVQSVP